MSMPEGWGSTTILDSSIQKSRARRERSISLASTSSLSNKKAMTGRLEAVSEESEGPEMRAKRSARVSLSVLRRATAGLYGTWEKVKGVMKRSLSVRSRRLAGWKKWTDWIWWVGKERESSSKERRW